MALPLVVGPVASLLEGPGTPRALAPNHTDVMPVRQVPCEVWGEGRLIWAVRANVPRRVLAMLDGAMPLEVVPPRELLPALGARVTGGAGMDLEVVLQIFGFQENHAALAAHQ